MKKLIEVEVVSLVSTQYNTRQEWEADFIKYRNDRKWAYLMTCSSSNHSYAIFYKEVYEEEE